MKAKNPTACLASAILCAMAASLPASASDAPAFDNFKGQTELLACRSVAQDSTGMIWFGTDRCLWNFDGHELQSHRADGGRILVNCILPAGGMVLFGCNDGLYTYDIYEDSVRRCAEPDSGVRTLVRSGGEIYAGTESGLFRIGISDGRAVPVKLTDDSIFSMAAVGDSLVLGTRDGLLTRGGKDMQSIGKDMATSSVVTALYPCADGIWIGTPTALMRIGRHGGRPEELVRLPVVKTICMNEDGCILAGTDNGIYRYSPAGGECTRVNMNIAWSSFRDRDGNLWFATDNGLLVLRQGSPISGLDNLPPSETALYTHIMLDSRGRLWLGSTQGLVLMPEYAAKGAGSIARRFSVEDNSSHIPHNKIRNITEDGDGNIWISSDVGYLRYDEGSGSFVNNRPEGDADNYYYDLLPDGNGFWLASWNGLYRTGRDGRVLEHFTTGDGLSTDDIQEITRDANGDIWILTRDQRAFILNPENSQLVQWKPAPTGPEPLTDCIFSDSAGTVWLSSSNRIWRIEPGPDGLKMSHTYISASPSVETWSMAEVEDSIMLCTTEGLFSISRDRMDVHSLKTAKNYVSICYDEAARRILLGTLGKVETISENDVRSLYGNVHGRPVITRVIVNGSHEIPYKELKGKKLRLPHAHNNIRIFFSDFSYNDDFSQRFMLGMEGDGSDWHETISGNTVTLPEIKPGRYRIQISSTEDHALESDALEIRILRPWWLSTPMILVYIAVFLGTAFLTVRFLTLKRYLELQRQQQDNIVRQSRQKEAFFVNVAHEFKTPLSLVIAPLGKAISECGGPGSLDDMKLAMENAMKLSSLIHNTLDYYNNSKGIADSLVATEVEFTDFARSIFNSWKENCGGHEFIFTSGRESIPVKIDVVKMETILNNLLSNACKYTPEGGSIILSADADDSRKELIVKVSDTGIGIPEDELPFVFQRYFESSRSKQGGYDSTGIGLSVIKGYVELHGGHISAASDSQGTTFTMTIPCLCERPERSGTTVAAATDNTDKPLVVIVDDNVQICGFIESVLKDRYRCISSHNGKSGLKLCEDVIPDLIISDVLMPVMDGLEMCRRIRRNAALATVPVVLLTAKADTVTEKESIGLNIDAFIPKPFDIGTLSGRIDQLLASRRRMEQKLRLEMLSSPSGSRELSSDEKYLKKVTDTIEEHLDDSDLNVGKLCELGGWSEKQLYRKLKQFTGMSIVEYIRSIRLKKAAMLLQNGNFTIAEVMYTVGFSNASYFSRAFSAAYGMTPSDYMKRHRSAGK